MVVSKKLLSLTVLMASAAHMGNAKMATRFWDCCKPSSSWSGKGDVIAPVDVCKADGVTRIPLSQADKGQSGCNGGDQFVCNSMQPYSDKVNSALGYGYIAFPTTDESATSCGCFHYTFQGGKKVKEMIVQAINVGGDVNAGNIDLQIPGGGVGMFANGCSNQWGATLGHPWPGQQYGGVGSPGDCAKLPEALQAGCDWRFDAWGDNPLIVEGPVRVKCPKSIIDGSGCQRKDELSQKPYSGKVSPGNEPVTEGYVRKVPSPSTGKGTGAESSKNPPVPGGSSGGGTQPPSGSVPGGSTPPGHQGGSQGGATGSGSSGVKPHGHHSHMPHRGHRGNQHYTSHQTKPNPECDTGKGKGNNGFVKESRQGKTSFSSVDNPPLIRQSSMRAS